MPFTMEGLGKMEFLEHDAWQLKILFWSTWQYFYLDIWFINFSLEVNRKLTILYLSQFSLEISSYFTLGKCNLPLHGEQKTTSRFQNATLIAHLQGQVHRN